MRRLLWLFLLVLIPACSPARDVPSRSLTVLGVELGGSVEDLKAVYAKAGLPLTSVSGNRYRSARVVAGLDGFPVIEVEYKVSSGRLRVIEVRIGGDVASDLEIYLDEEYSTDPAERRQSEQKFSTLGTIGENDHIWSLQDMGIGVVAGEIETKVVYRFR